MSAEAPPAPAVTLEIDDGAQLLAIANESRLPSEAVASLQQAFFPSFAEARKIIEQSRTIVVTDASEALGIKMSRTCRLALRDVRTKADQLRKALKEESLRRGKAIDGFYNILLHLIEVEETRLGEQEKIVERAEAARKAALNTERTTALAAYGMSLTGLGEMADETWAQLLENTRLAHEAKIAAARKAEEERIRLENERLKEEARVREENARLKREADEREAALKAERERVAKEQAAAAEVARKEREALEAKAAEERRVAAEAARVAAEAARIEREKAEAAAAAEQARLAEIAAAERRAREAAEAKLKAEREEADRVAREQAEREAREQREAAEAKRLAELAPDREKLAAVAKDIRAIGIPLLAHDEARAVTAMLRAKIEKLAAWVEEEAKRL